MALNKYIAIYVPSLDADGGEINEKEREEVLIHVERVFIECFGGFTEIEVKGERKGENGKLVKGVITIIKSFYEMQSDETVMRKARFVAMGLKSKLRQECISIEQNGNLYFV
jgi:hypothetical protein